MEEVNGATEKISQLDYETELNQSKAKQNMGEMVLRFGVAGYFDTRAQGSAANFVSCGTNTCNKIKEDPKMMIEHRELVAAINDSMSVTKMVSGNIVSQAKQIGSISTGLIDYAQKHNIEIPSTQELQQEVKINEPKMDDDDLT